MLLDAKQICLNSINKCLPDSATIECLNKLNIEDEVYLLAVGKASFSMAKAASKILNIKKGIVISKYGHILDKLDNIDCYEAAHPISDINGINATKKIIELCSNLNSNDKVVFLLSGGASALFEDPLIPLDELQDLNNQMLKKGLDIIEINTIRKKLSNVKGGKLAKLCEPAKVYSIILSDVLDDRLEFIGSGPTISDEADSKKALDIINKYNLDLSKQALNIIQNSKPIIVNNSSNYIIGSVKLLCEYAKNEAIKLGYEPIVISNHINIEARDAGNLLFDNIKKYINDNKNYCLIMTGETTVHVKGNGIGGRNQELVFSQIKNISDLNNVLIMSLGSDGTDGPTDAAGGYVDTNTYELLKSKNINYEEILNNNDTYNGLKAINQLIITGPTGTNVNDISIALIKKGE